MIAGNYNFAQNILLEVNAHLENLGIVLSIEDNEHMYSCYANDFVLKVSSKDAEYKFLSHTKKQLTENIAASLIDRFRVRQSNYPFLIVADYMSPETQKYLIKNSVSFINRSGKIYINQSPLLLYTDYPKILKKSPSYGRAFEVSGLKLTFHLLSKPDNVNKPYQQLAHEVGIATGSISLIIKNLKKEGFVYSRHSKRFLRNKRELLEQWWVAYGRKLRPIVFVGRYRVIENPLKIDLPKESWWGGEVAADLMGLGLKSQNQIIYTSTPPLDIVRALRLVPDENGQLELLNTFWGTQSVELYNEKTVSEMLVYADLMLSKNDRNREAADELLENRIFSN